MLAGLASALRFARSWTSRPASGLRESEVNLEVPGWDAPVSGTVVAPGGSHPRPGWVALHGITRRGRTHPELRRFVRAVASTGRTVLVPEIREWVDLRFAPERAQEILRAAVSWMHAAPGTAPGGVMLAGFSFGGPQALLAASDPELAVRLRGVLAWGGYADLERTFRFAFTGEHAWRGTVHGLDPDPYTRWVIGANCVRLSPDLEEPGPLAHALHTLASAAGEQRITSGGPDSDPLKADLRRALSGESRALFDLFAPRADRRPDPVEAWALVSDLIPRIRQEFPLLEPASLIREISVPVRLLHGRSDALIPFTETLRLAQALGPGIQDLSTRIIGLFTHTGEDRGGDPTARAREGLQFLRALEAVFRIG